MTFEKILEVFADFIASQATTELIKSKHGYVFLEWTPDYDYAAEAAVCTTPERMLEFLSSGSVKKSAERKHPKFSFPRSSD